MTTLQGFFSQAVHRTTKATDNRRFWASARDALGIALILALLAAGLALRVLVYVRLS